MIEINGAQRIIHRRPSPAHFVLPWGDGLRERYCSQKEKAHSFLLSVRHSQRLPHELSALSFAARLACHLFLTRKVDRRALCDARRQAQCVPVG